MHILRALTLTETLLYIIYESFKIPVACNRIKIKGYIEATLFQEAINKVQVKHSLLQATIGIKQNKAFFYIPDSIPPIILQIYPRENEDYWKDFAVMVLKNKFDTHRGPLIKVFLLKNDKESIYDFLVISHHSISDKLSHIIFFNDLFMFYEELLKNKNEDVKNKNIIANKHANLLIDGVKQSKNELTQSISTYLLSTEETSKLVAICRKHSVTMFGLLTTIYLQAVYDVIVKVKSMKVLVPVDVRRLLHPSYKNKIGCYIYFAEMIYPPPATKQMNIWSTAKYYKEQINKIIHGIDIAKFTAPSTKNIRLLFYFCKIVGTLIKIFSRRLSIIVNVAGKFSMPSVESELSVEAYNWFLNHAIKIKGLSMNVITVNDCINFTFHTYIQDDLKDKIIAKVLKELSSIITENAKETVQLQK